MCLLIWEYSLKVSFVKCIYMEDTKYCFECGSQYLKTRTLFLANELRNFTDGIDESSF